LPKCAKCKKPVSWKRYLFSSRWCGECEKKYAVEAKVGRNVFVYIWLLLIFNVILCFICLPLALIIFVGVSVWWWTKGRKPVKELSEKLEQKK